MLRTLADLRRDAAELLEVPPQTLADLIERHGLGKEYRRHARGRGRPRKAP